MTQGEKLDRYIDYLFDIIESKIEMEDEQILSNYERLGVSR